MPKYIVEGGSKLKGEIEIKGSKNEAYQVICASILTKDKVIINNIPDIIDIQKILSIIQLCGVKLEKLKSGTYSINASNLNNKAINSLEFHQKASSIRGTIMLLAPFLMRFGSITIPKPGGDKIGRRPIDVHLNAFRQLGAKIDYEKTQNLYHVSIKKIKKSYIVLEEASVTGTANIIMAASLINSETTIYNAASEPYIEQLAKMLISMGAKIFGAGTNKIIIKGKTELKGTTHDIMPDIIEVGSFIGLAACTQSSITLTNIPPKKILFPIINNFEKLGIKIQLLQNSIHIPALDKYIIKKTLDGTIINISDNIWPGFPADLISIALVSAIQCKGTVLFRQRMFESRLYFVDLLIEMGAQIILCDPHRAVVIGLEHKYKLNPSNMKSPDIRAGLAMLIAALSADGQSVISNCEQIDRGYEDIDKRLNLIGAKIKKIN